MSAMSIKIDRLIASSVVMDEYINPVAYDETHDHVSYGYWLCKLCKNIFHPGVKACHGNKCPLKNKLAGGYPYANGNIIYVLGPKELGPCSPFRAEDIQRIVQIAKNNKIYSSEFLQRDEELSKELGKTIDELDTATITDEFEVEFSSQRV